MENFQNFLYFQYFYFWSNIWQLCFVYRHRSYLHTLWPLHLIPKHFCFGHFGTIQVYIEIWMLLVYNVHNIFYFAVSVFIRKYIFWNDIVSELGVALLKILHVTILVISVMAPRSTIWKYFTRLSKETSQCKMCLKNLKTSGNTTNLGNHLKQKHSDIYKSLFGNLQDAIGEKKRKTSTSPSKIEVSWCF